MRLKVVNRCYTIQVQKDEGEVMSLDSFCNLYEMGAIVIGILLCLFRYIKYQTKSWIFAVLFLLSNFLSSFYWAVYTFIIEDDPITSDFMAYFGWDIGFVFLLLLLRHVQSREEKRYINLIMFLPVPLNIIQFYLYIPYGGIINNIYQGIICTVIACVSLQSILYYLKHRRERIKSPYVAVVALLFITCNYGMWTSTCFSWDDDLTNPYYYFSLVGFSLYIIIVWALQKTYDTDSEAFRSRPLPASYDRERSCHTGCRRSA